MKKLLYLLFISSLFIQAESNLPYNKVVLWGHKLHSHTHSYIHWGFKRAFERLGYKVYWLDKKDKISNLDLSNAIFITEGQVDQGMPLLKSSFYVLHNCNNPRYRNFIKQGNAFNLQVSI